MATRKTQTTAKKNWGWPVNPTDTPKQKNTKNTKNTRNNKNIEKTIKNLGFKAICIFALIIILGALIGGISCYYITKDDCFTIIGQEEITLNANDTYTDEGVKVISFGKDCRDKITIETDLKLNSDGTYSVQLDNESNPILKTYYIIYRADTIKYSKLAAIKRIRLISFVEASDDNVED